MGLVNNSLAFTRPGVGGLQKKHQINVLDRVMVDGQVKVYTDSTKNAKKEEILAPGGGRVIIIKDFAVDPKSASYKTIEIYSDQDELLDSITIVEEKMIKAFRFYSGNNPIGKGYGDIGIYIAQKILGEGVLDPRYTAGSSVDADVITFIANTLRRKTV